MPSSTYKHINVMVEEIVKTNPKNILDIGIGSGKWGFLCREYLEMWNNRVFPAEWALKIDGIEIFPAYIERFSWLGSIYSNIYEGDAYNLIDNANNYDLIIAGDIIEHLDKSKGIELIKKCIKKSNKAFLMSIPTGDWLHNKTVAGNEHEEHQAIWELEDLVKIGNELNVKMTYHMWEWNTKKGYVMKYFK